MYYKVLMNKKSRVFGNQNIYWFKIFFSKLLKFFFAKKFLMISNKEEIILVLKTEFFLKNRLVC